MNPDCSQSPARPHRRLDRLIGLAAVLGLSLAAMPTTGLASGRAAAGHDWSPFGLIDLAETGEALSRGELPVELLVAGSLAAVAVGFALTLIVGVLRHRRSAHRPEPAPAASSDDIPDARATLPWPAADAAAFRAAPPPTDTPRSIDEQAPTPEPVQPAPPPEEQEVVEMIAVDAVEPETAPGMEPAWTRPDPPLPAAAVAAIQSTIATRAETPFARSALGTPDAPLVVELRDQREPVGDRRRTGPNLPLVVAIATVAVGVAFTAGAAVGATLGVGAGAAIGLAFAGGAGVAIGATVAMLGGGRR